MNKENISNNPGNIFFNFSEEQSLLNFDFSISQVNESPSWLPDYSPFNFKASNSISPSIKKRNEIKHIENCRNTKIKETTDSSQFKLKPIESSRYKNKLDKPEPKDEDISTPSITSDFNEKKTKKKKSQYFDILLNDSVEEREGIKADIVVLRNTLTVFDILSSYLNGHSVDTLIDKVSKSYEIEILSIFASWLNLKNSDKGFKNINERAKFIYRFSPNRTCKRERVIQTIFTTCHRELEREGNLSNQSIIDQDEQYINFYSSFFENNEKEEESVKKANLMNYRLNMNSSGNLSLQYITQLMQNKKYREKFTEILTNKFTELYHQSRKTWLRGLMEKIETYFFSKTQILTCPFNIKYLFGAKKPKLPYHNEELKKYFNFFLSFN